MALADPRDFLADFPGVSPRFDLVPMINVDPTRSGSQPSLDIGPSLWYADYKSRILKPSELRYWKAVIASLHGHAFLGYDLAGCYPRAYPNGTWPTGASFDGVASLLSVESVWSVILGGLPPGYVGSVGDYFGFLYGGKYALHQVMEPFTADSGGETAAFEVRPEIRPGYVLSPEPDVQLVKPKTTMRIVPGSVSAPGNDTSWGAISFSARQSLE